MVVRVALVTNCPVQEVILHKGDPVIGHGNEEQWHLPGDWVADSESLNAAAIRIVREQLGYEEITPKFLTRDIYDRGDMKIDCFVFGSTCYPQEPQGDKRLEIGFYRLDEITQGRPPLDQGHKALIVDCHRALASNC